MKYSLLLISLIGFLLSLYAIYVERMVKYDKNYKAICDISEKISCSKAFASGYGKIFFGISNGIIGTIFYALIAALNFYGLTNFIFYLSVLSVIGSIYLAYILNFKVKTICLVCYSIYIINILLLIFSFRG